ncbi:DUF480 domain-containing protein [candidate division KSB1 bacterium]|nr:DUF480 domain-containing protein [candidate division KSB1 bacterium]
MKLSLEAARVFGCLIEKSQATPEYYPMTLNALIAACNQKTSRDPVVEYSSEEVEEALGELKEKGLCAYVSGDGRVMKYAHRGGENGLDLSLAQLAALSLILLRGPQTVGEIKGRAGRQYEFASLEEAQEVIESLEDRTPALLEQAPRQVGQKETRYRHLFFEYAEAIGEAAKETASSSLRAEVESLKQLVAGMQERIEMLEKELRQIKTDLY